MAGKPIKDVVGVAKKYTQQSYGIWETIRKIFAMDPTRSNGVPVKHFRNPTPGGLDPLSYDPSDAVTTPAADIADNPYWKRDVRRAYPKLSTVTQGDVVGLLTVGSAANPSPKLLAGEEGSKQLVAVKTEGEKGLAAYFEREKTPQVVLSEDGLPPKPAAFGRLPGKKYEIGPTSYGESYPCRSFV
ncbi:NADH dehydrogenase [Capronia coronata CBS 617.96]|uniref:NADH dehydrogenase n=1 Tax=Capronia coronata CBS 617.96 TaxID=1182541 RepID=W9Y157_9EURO|nr:NADH dehydrogenase [Capronia coronata CBS 617.96]EXJ86228.1 NADH dehydrogenase [Capronia coronata CBS 617.96]